MTVEVMSDTRRKQSTMSHRPLLRVCDSQCQDCHRLVQNVILVANAWPQRAVLIRAHLFSQGSQLLGKLATDTTISDTETLDCGPGNDLLNPDGELTSVVSNFDSAV